MPGSNQKKYKAICSVLLISYTTLMVVVSFHFHSISNIEVSFYNAEKDFSTHSGSDILPSDGVCQFLLTYKSNADLFSINGPGLSIYLAESKLILTELSYRSSESNNNTHLRAPPSVPFV